MVLYIVEALLEKVVISMKNPQAIDYNRLNKEEHQLSGVYWMALVLALVVITADQMRLWYYLVPALIIERRIFFEYTLKIVRNKRTRDIEGDQFWDKIMRGILGARGGHIEFILLIAGLSVLAWLMLK